jgi:hypothetical protein
MCLGTEDRKKSKKEGRITFIKKKIRTKGRKRRTAIHHR